MFRRLPDRHATVRVVIDGRAVDAAAGDTVMAALLLAGVARFRTTPKSGAPRGPFCGMGACFDCVVTVDGVGARQACLVTVREGMRIDTGAGRRALAAGDGA